MDHDEPPILRIARERAKQRKERGEEGPRVLGYWENRLEEWLEAVLQVDPDMVKGQPDDLQTWSFPTKSLREQYIASIGCRSEREVRKLIRHFLFDASTFHKDEDVQYWMLRQYDLYQDLQEKYEYFRRLDRAILGGKIHAQPGVRWALDLLPDSPLEAISVIRSYLRVHDEVLAEGRAYGLEDAIDVIDSYYISSHAATSLDPLFNLSPREFEVLVANLYRKMGYRAVLTPPRRDGGRDVIAERSELGERRKILIECKQYGGTVKVGAARALLGVVATERANGGVLITTGTCSKGVRDLAESDDRFDFVDGEMLVLLMNQNFGLEWHRRLVRLCTNKPRSMAQ